jgi:hypothetical protein
MPTWMNWIIFTWAVKNIVWETKQTGASERMKVDKGLIKLIGLMEGQLSVLPNGNEIIGLIKQYI